MFTQAGEAHFDLVQLVVSRFHRHHQGLPFPTERQHAHTGRITTVAISAKVSQFSNAGRGCTGETHDSISTPESSWQGMDSIAAALSFGSRTKM